MAADVARINQSGEVIVAAAGEKTVTLSGATKECTVHVHNLGAGNLNVQWAAFDNIPATYTYGADNTDIIPAGSSRTWTGIEIISNGGLTGTGGLSARFKSTVGTTFAVECE